MNPTIPRAYFPWFLAALAVFALFFELGRMDVTEENEGQRVTPPYEMIQSGDYLVPTLNGDVYLAKPPLLYWIIAGVYNTTGVVSEWTGRIPTAAFGVLIVLVAYFAFSRLAGGPVGQLSAIALLATPYFMERSRWASLDIPLLFFTFVAVLAAWAAWRNENMGRKLGFALLAGIALGGGGMLKGPAPYVFMITAYLAFIIVSGNQPGKVLRTGLIASLVIAIVELGRMLLLVPFPVGLLLVALVWIGAAAAWARRRAWGDLALLILVLLIGAGIAAPWAIAVLDSIGWDSVRALLEEQVVERTYMASAINFGTPFYYILNLPLILAPWGLLLPLHLSKKAWETGDNVYRFSLVMGWLSVICFSMFAGKEHEYILPAFPFLLLATGYHIRDLITERFEGLPARYGRYWIRAVFGLFVVLAAGMPVYVAFEEFHPVLLAQEILLGVAILSVVFWRVQWRHTERAYLRLGAAATLGILTILLSRAYHYTGEDSPKEIGLASREIIEAGHRLDASVVYAAFAFYARHPVDELAYEDVDRIRRRLESEEPYFYLTREEAYQKAMRGEGVHVLMGPIEKKELMLIANEAGKQAFKQLGYELEADS